MPVREVTHHAHRVWRAVEAEASLWGDLPHPQIVTSWRRCIQEHGLDPANANQPTVLDAAKLREYREAFGPHLEVARVEMENLYQQISGSGFAIVLVGREGAILTSVVDPALEGSFARAGLIPGALWSEQFEGTNGMGTCLEEQRPITVHRHEHFRGAHIDLTCSAAPIRNPQGDLIAVLDVSAQCTADFPEHQCHTMALVKMSARLLENCSFLQEYRGEWIIRFHSRPEFVGLLNEAMLAMDGNGNLLAASPSALKQLGFSSSAELVGQPVDRVLDTTAEMIRSRAYTHTHTVWPIRELKSGKRFFAQLRGPELGRLIGTTNGHRTSECVTVPCTARPPSMNLEVLAGGDARMAYNARCARRVMNRNVPILLLGETGTGKEAFARAIHQASDRSQSPFVALNCASIPESLIESELFGYRHGAFTGARREGMRGKVLQSSGGTLFLDEIGDMPNVLQTRLLRVLEEREVVPLGSDDAVAVELSVICATHRNLSDLVERELFRDDLYYRLNGISLLLPPLRDRSDRDSLVRDALAAENDSGEEISVEKEAFRLLLSCKWPGNIRQLRNVLRAAIALCDDRVIRVADLPHEIVWGQKKGAGGSGEWAYPVPEVPNGPDRGEARNVVVDERERLIRELEHQHWNVTGAAHALGISRNTLYRKIKRHGICIVRRH